MGQFLYFLSHTIRIYSHGLDMSCLLSDLNKHEARFWQVTGDRPSHMQEDQIFQGGVFDLPIVACQPVASTSVTWSCFGAKISYANVLTGQSNHSIIMLPSCLTKDELLSQSQVTVTPCRCMYVLQRLRDSCAVLPWGHRQKLWQNQHWTYCGQRWRVCVGSYIKLP